MAAFAQATCLLGELVAFRLVAPGFDGVEDRDGQAEPLGGGGGSAVQCSEGGEAFGVAVEGAAARVELARELGEEVVGNVGRAERSVRARGDTASVAAGADRGLTTG
jgi:hypothetical protein